MRTKQPRSMIFATVAGGAFLVLNIFSLYLLLRGHNYPGGGFIAGLVTAISIIMLSLAVGWEEIHRVIRIDPVSFTLAGLGLATASSTAPMFWNFKFLENFMAHWKLPLLGELHVGTTLFFDTGVFLVVVGITCKIIFVLGKSTEELRALVSEEEECYSAPMEEPIEGEPFQPEIVKAEEDRRAT